MPVDYKRLTRKYARRHGLDPHIFQRQIGAESGWAEDVITGRRRSSAGAQGIAQIMPATARGWGVDPLKPRAALNAAAKNMAKYVKQYGSYEAALRAYNAGPAAIEKSKGYGETNAYVAKILQGRDPKRLGAPRNQSASRDTSRASSLSGLTGTSQDAPEKPNVYDVIRRFNEGTMGEETEDNSLDEQLAQSQSMLLEALARKNKPDDVGPVQQPNTTSPGVGGKRSAGADAAIDWASSKIGFKETGTNAGGVASYLNRQFGMSAQPWCAMFTSAAVTKGGADSSARTASVAEVRAKARAKKGYVGFVSSKQARKGDLILFGNAHIGMVEKVEGNKIVMIAGNDSDGVQRRRVGINEGDIVRPKYGARRRK